MTKIEQKLYNLEGYAKIGNLIHDACVVSNAKVE